MLTPRVLWIANHAANIIDRFRISLTQADGLLDGLRAVRDEDYNVVLVSFPLALPTTVASLLEELQQAAKESRIATSNPRICSSVDHSGTLKIVDVDDQ
jgi:hypothetical protein